MTTLSWAQARGDLFRQRIKPDRRGAAEGKNSELSPIAEHEAHFTKTSAAPDAPKAPVVPDTTM
jgi:hypothetical protein